MDASCEKCQDAGLVEPFPALKFCTCQAGSLRAEAFRDALAYYYGCPVLPLREFCAALTAWAQLVGRRGAEFRSYAPHLGTILVDIEKSNLLYRLLYLREKVRFRPCPEHLGKSNAGMLTGMQPPCRYGCEGTGWLPDPIRNASAAVSSGGRKDE